MIVVADTGPLNYLILLGHIEVLHILYGEVVIPPAVQDELLDPSAPEPVRSWISSPPPWLEIRTPGRIDPRLSRALDEGELEAITLAQQGTGEVLLAIDERRGRSEAQKAGLKIIGTLGILEEAHRRGLLNLREAVEKLRQTSFSATDALFQEFLDRS